MNIQRRDLPMAIILTIITCGIYGYYWMYKMTEDVNTVSGDNTINPGMTIVFTIITCGIYGYYWVYKMGKLVAQGQQRNNMMVNDNSILYLILAILGLSIVDYALIQDNLNDMATYNSNGQF